MKVLFYGNCQLAVIADWWCKFFPEHEVYKLSDMPVKIDKFDDNDVLFASWAQSDMSEDNQKLIAKQIHDRVKDVDIFMFQSHNSDKFIDELKTDYLYSLSRGIAICVPNIVMTLYPTDLKALQPHIQYAKSFINDTHELIEYLQNSDDEHLVELLDQEFPISKKFVPYRGSQYTRLQRDLDTYGSACIDITSFVEQQYDKKFLTITHNHMSHHFHEVVLKQILQMVDVNVDSSLINKCTVRGSGRAYTPTQFNFFRKRFPELKENDYIDVCLRASVPRPPINMKLDGERVKNYLC